MPKDQKGSAWCRGFLRGTAFFGEEWHRLWEQPDLGIFVHSIQMLAGALVDRKREAGTMRVGMTRI